MKILRAAGEHGKHDKYDKPCHFNWCDTLEPVGIQGIICCNSDRCGCNRSFCGIQSAKSTTKAVVTEVTEQEFEHLCSMLYSTTIKGWSIKGDDDAVLNKHLDELTKNLAARNVDNYRAFVKDLAEYPPGTVLGVKRKNNPDGETETVELKIIA
jgi:hypothetical protein